MTQEEKNLFLLLKDLCGRLPYEVKMTDGVDTYRLTSPFLYRYIFEMELKPYLRPMSSMTEEEIDNLSKFHIWNNGKEIFPDCNCGLNDIIDAIEWLNAHYFDYRDLIEQGLALEAPEGMYKN